MSGLKKGDVVRLMSGGPEMTIYKREACGNIPDAAFVVWFTELEEKKTDVFDVNVLQLVTTDGFNEEDDD